MPTPFHCIECDKPFLAQGKLPSNICQNCLEDLTEPTTADAHNLRFVTSLSEYNEDKLETTPNRATERK